MDCWSKNLKPKAKNKKRQGLAKEWVLEGELGLNPNLAAYTVV